jgi:thioredoxin reductase (NADPH)
MELMRQQAVNMGTRIVTDDILKVDFSSRPFKLYPSEGGVVEAQCVIVATGASANWLGLPSEERFKNRGVSACAVCDGALPRFRNKPIVVVGGGDSAVEEATYLTKFASTVHLVHRRDQLRASKIMAQRAHDDPKIKIHFNTGLAEVLGDDAKGVTGVQGTVNQQVRVMRLQGFALRFGFLGHHRCAQHQVRHHHRGIPEVPHRRRRS